ncbi:MAG TPA: lipid II flippase MurJ, partial [Bacillota bacterium]|nr:lipid II flippase MurJ [Bacillota bacterium]
RPGVPVNHPDLKKILKLIIPITVGISISETYILIDRYLASGLAEGSISALNYALKLAQIPAGLFATAVGTAVFPSLTRLAAANDLRSLGEGVRRALRLVTVVCVPAAVIMLVMREQLVTLFYFRGAFDIKAVQMTAAALFFYSFGVAGLAGEFVLVRGFYSLQDTRTPVIISVIAVLTNLAFSLALIGPLRHGGLALANSIAALTSMILLTACLNRRVKGLWTPEMWKFLALVMAAAAVMGGVIELMNGRAAPAPGGYVPALIAKMCLDAAAGLIVYVLFLTAFRFEEARQLWETARRGVFRIQSGRSHD